MGRIQVGFSLVAGLAEGLEVGEGGFAAFGPGGYVVYFEAEVGMGGGGSAAGLAAEAVSLEGLKAHAEAGSSGGFVNMDCIGFWVGWDEGRGRRGSIYVLQEGFEGVGPG